MARNTVLNLIGQVAPALVALAAIPYTVHGLGVERFGILSLAMVGLGYLNIFDLGLGRATTRFVASALGAGDATKIPGIVWTSLAAQALVGTGCGLILAAGTPHVVGRVLNVPEHLAAETEALFYLLSLSLPVIVSTASLRGLLEAAQRFDLVNLVRTISNSLVFLLPALGVALGLTLPWMVFLLVASVGAGALAYLVFGLRVFPALRRSPGIEPRLVRPLLAYGGWVTVSGVVVPVLAYSERLLIAALVSVPALAYYSVPFDIVSRLQVFPSSFGAALFPSLASEVGRRERLQELYERSLRYLLLVMGPVTLLLIVLARSGLETWLGSDFATEGAIVLQILALARLVNALSQMPANLLDAVGRPDLRAKILASYAAVYVAMAWLLVSSMGIVGAGLAWMLRSFLEMSLFAVAVRISMGPSSPIWPSGGFIAVAVAYSIFSFALIGAMRVVQIGVVGDLVLAAATAALFCWVAWCHLLDDIERGSARAKLQQLCLGCVGARARWLW